MYILKNGCRFLAEYTPPPTFHYETGVQIGKCEISSRQVSFGAYSYINSGFIRSHVSVGRYCSIGRNVTLGSGIHNLTSFSTHPIFEKKIIDTSREQVDDKNWIFMPNGEKYRIIIGNDVWIGDYAYIMSGVKVGDGAVIGAGSIVTKDVDPYSIVVGTPAKHLKYRFSNDVINRLLRLRWFEFLYETIEDIDMHSDHIEEKLSKLESIPDSNRVPFGSLMRGFD